MNDGWTTTMVVGTKLAPIYFLSLFILVTVSIKASNAFLSTPSLIVSLLRLCFSHKPPQSKSIFKKKTSIMRINKFLFTCLLVGLSCVVSQETATAEDVTTGATTEEEIGEGNGGDAATTEESASATDPNGDIVDDGETAQTETATESVEEEEAAAAAAAAAAEEVEEAEPVQTGPFIDLFGTQLYSMEILDETSAQMRAHYTNEALEGKKVVGVYFSADWCGPCRQFTPELVSFYEKMNKRRGKKDQFQIVWVSRCRDVNSYAQYFAHMPGFYALPPEEAMGVRGQTLSDKYKVKGIPTLVLLDDLGNVITTDARNKIPQDKAGIGFPWRSPLAQITSTLFPRSLRLMIKMQADAVKTKLIAKIKGIVGLGPKQPVSA